MTFSERSSPRPAKKSANYGKAVVCGLLFFLFSFLDRYKKGQKWGKISKDVGQNVGQIFLLFLISVKNSNIHTVFIKQELLYADIKYPLCLSFFIVPLLYFFLVRFQNIINLIYSVSLNTLAHIFANVRRDLDTMPDHSSISTRSFLELNILQRYFPRVPKEILLFITKLDYFPNMVYNIRRQER